MAERQPARRRGRLAWIVVVSGLVGCAREAEPIFVYQSAVEGQGAKAEDAIDAKHQTQIKEILTRHFGTPSNPAFRIAGKASDQDAAGAEKSKDSLVQHLPGDRLKAGAEVYARLCQSCHGVTGDGNGQAAQFLNPLPRDYRLGKFKFVCGSRDSKPRREDLMRIVRRGAKGTAMPAFRWLPDEEMEPLLDYVTMLSCRGELELRLIRAYKEDELDTDEKTNEKASYDEKQVNEYLSKIVAAWDQNNHPAVLPATPISPDTAESRQEGARLFIKMSCYSCHGRDARGAKIGKNDDWGQAARSADLPAGMLHGGRRPIDIYRRIAVGVSGTPMPGSESATEAGETREMRSQKIWNLVHFIMSVVDGQDIPPDLRNEMEKLANELEAKAAKGAAGAAVPGEEKKDGKSETPKSEKNEETK